MGTQELVLGGCYEGGESNCVTSSHIELCPRLKCHAVEADTREWLHFVNSGGTKKVLFSPDTDVYIIGLTNVNHDVRHITRCSYNRTSNGRNLGEMCKRSHY